METKFKVGDHVRITWRPPFQKHNLFGSNMIEALERERIIEALEREHIIARVLLPSNGRTRPTYRVDYPGLSGTDFFDEELQLLPLRPLVLQKNDLPDI